MSSNETALGVAEVIRAHIGRVGFAMAGATHLRSFNDSEGAAHGLEFRVRRNMKRVEWVKVSLDLSGAYSVEFSAIGTPSMHPHTFKVTAGRRVVLSSVSGVSGEALAAKISEGTGMDLTLIRDL